MIVAVSVITGLVGLYFVYRYAISPITWRVKVSDLHPYLETLLRRGYNGSFVTIREPKSERFVQLAKYIKARGQIGLELGFPRTSWSVPYYAKLEDFLRESAVPFNRRPVATTPTTEFLEVDFGRDTAAADPIVNVILTRIFEIPLSTVVKVRFSNLSLYDELIDDMQSDPTERLTH